MDSNRKEMCKSLVDWFKVLIRDDASLKSDHLDDLSDGVAMARALNKLGPEFFTGKIGRNKRSKIKWKEVYVAFPPLQIRGCQK